jgi:hypothetical protein
MSAAAELERLADGRFAPGCSGNPRGRPPTPLEIRRVLAAKQWSALARLLRNIESGNDAAANTAAIWLLEQHIGKPVQQLEAQVTDIGAAHLLAVSAAANAAVILDLPAEAGQTPELAEPEPAPLLDWAGLDAPVQHAPQRTPEFDR